MSAINIYIMNFRIDGRCAFGNFNCGERNPCSPGGLCVEGVLNYPGPSPNRYVTCDACSACSEHQCERRYIFDPEAQTCVPKDEG